jgi:hypothetical protein
VSGKTIYFVRDVPQDLTRRELVEGVQKALRAKLWQLFPVYPKVLRVEFLQVRGVHDGGKERHGLVWVGIKGKPSDVAARLERFRVRGWILTAHPYLKRAPYKDRRRLGYDGRDLEQERRRGDRRRSGFHLEIEEAPFVDGVSVGHRLSWESSKA